jgi:transcription antitermination factor NusA-like protein
MSSDQAATSSSNGTAGEETGQLYDNVFPPLAPGLLGNSAHLPSASSWGKPPRKMVMRSSTVTQVFTVPVEERRFKEIAEQFGDKNQQQAKICQDIMSKCDVTIEMSKSRDQSLTVVITGKTDKVQLARKLIVQQLQTQASTTVNIPKEHHRFILGPKGARLKELELNTATKINIPRLEDNDTMVKIIGTKEGLEKARHEIQLISDEQAKLAFERLAIPKVYHPFIQGPDQEITKELMERTKARISVPPLSVHKDEIVVAGEKEGVAICVQAILAIYNDKKQHCTTVSVEVRKSQHKYVIGPKGSNLSEILRTRDVSVEVPSQDSVSDTITLRGHPDKLGGALTDVYAKANSVVMESVDAPSWLHRFIIGKKGVNVRKITAELPKVHIEFTDGEDKIRVEGPPSEVAKAKAELEEITKDLLAKMAFAEIDVDQKYHRHIIGRAGANVTRIKNDTGVQIRIPGDQEPSNIIRIEGSPEGVATAKQELLDMVHKMENEKSRDILIEQRFHKSMIGAAGGKIKEIRDKFNQVQITFPESARKSDVVSLRGPKADVDKCYKYLTQLNQEMIVSNYQAEVHIFKQFHKNIIGKGGANIRKIRDETDTKIDLPAERSDSDVITITGKKERVEKAKQMIEAIQKDLANIAEVSIDIPHKFHNSIIGAKGRLIRSIMDECGGVIIRFPAENTKSDRVIIRGPKDDVENAKKQLLELAGERKESGHIEEIRCKPEYHKFLIGRGGSNIRKVRDATGARVIFPSNQDADHELITIMGKEDSAKQARAHIEDLIKDLDNIVEGEMDVDPKHHRHFVARRGEVLRIIAEEYGGVTVSFPRSGVKSSKVTLKGAKDCVEAAKNRIAEIVEDLESQVTVECVIEQKHHRTVMGAKGFKVQEITKEFEVGIKFPDRAPPVNNNAAQAAPAAPAAPTGDAPATDAAAAEPQMNGEMNGTVESNGEEVEGENGEKEEEEVPAGPNKCDIILITGKQENCNEAAKALQALVPITEEINVPYDMHRFIIGQKGRDVRKMMEDNDVNISIPPANDKSDIVRITGAPSNVAKARIAMEARMEQLAGEQKDRELRSFQLEVTVDPKHHPKIIGRRGAVISKIRDSHQVNIQFPEKNSENENVITITGYEDATKAAEQDIIAIVTELEDQVSMEVTIDQRVHPRLIGSRGRAIRQIMNDYKVDIKFSRDGSDPDLVTITGIEENVTECIDHLLNLAEEYLQDVDERQEYAPPSRQQQYQPPPSNPQGFVVKGAPWDPSSTTDFPELGGAAQGPKSAPSWGPSFRRH